MTATFAKGVDHDRLAAVCRRYSVTTLAAFGSTARGSPLRRATSPALRAAPRDSARVGDR